MSHSSHPLTLQLDASLPDRFRTLREYLAHRVQVQAKPLKAIAGDMDMAPSTLSRKLNPGDGDTQRFNVDDLEAYIQATGDTSCIEYLAAKYLRSDEERRAHALARVEKLSAELSAVLAVLKGGVEA